MTEICWLCANLGGVAIHNTATAQYDKTLWIAHRLESDSHPVQSCPACELRELKANLASHLRNWTMIELIDDGRSK